MLMFGSVWCLIMTQIGRLEHSLTSHPITSNKISFLPFPHLKVVVICVSPLIDILNDEKLIEDIIIKSNEFEIEAKLKLATLEKSVRKQQPDVKNTRQKKNVSMRPPKLEILKFCGDAKQWPEFWYSYEAAIDISYLMDVEKFNYLKTLVIGKATNAISGLNLMNGDYGKVERAIVSNIWCCSWKFLSTGFDSLLIKNPRTLNLSLQEHKGYLEPHEDPLAIQWRIQARETVNAKCKNVDSDEMLPFTGSSLVVGSKGTSHQRIKCCLDAVAKKSYWEREIGVFSVWVKVT